MIAIVFLYLTLSTLGAEPCYVKDMDKKCIKDGTTTKCNAVVTLSAADAMPLCVDAFMGNAYITSFVYEGTDKLDIGTNAFKGATKLSSFTAKAGIKTIGVSAFEGAAALTKIDISGATEIPANTFKNCALLETLTGTEAVTSVQAAAFSGCVKLTSVNFYAPLTSLLDQMTAQVNLFFHGTVEPTTLPTKESPINEKLKVYVQDSYTSSTFGTLTVLKAQCNTLQCVDVIPATPVVPPVSGKMANELKCKECDVTTMSVDGNNYYCEIDMTECIKTHDNCRICLNNKCTKCGTAVPFLENDKCVSQCTDGYYKDTTNSVCEKCDTGCKACTEKGKCTSCPDNHLLLDDTKKCTTDANCPAGYYKDNTNCMKCSITDCGECTSKTVCTKCTKGNLIKGGSKCEANCPDKFYPVNNVCTDCDTTCKKCTEAGKCTECPDNTFLIEDTKKCTTNSECPAGYTKDTANKKCFRCDVSCKTCKNSNTCETCAENYLFVEDTKKCVKDKCPENYFRVDKTCKACMSGCKTCTKANDCSACITGKLFEEGTMKCVDKCELGFFKKNDTNCDKCSENCEKCSVFEICDKCVDGALMSEKKCVNMCPEGTFEKTGVCEKCKDKSEYKTPCTDKECEMCTASGAFATLIMFAVALFVMF
ncbi:hypothetical protein EIN_291500 [Entamoeba invadens IP1]|uniref:Furin repeat-containing protein n=1 Tax=Entamoeba invadens IP1 TaxID=370355 RepID=A0A0A1UE48_ENTIV|nr:hypothetical protein EIN_291500 [Entamoeba invadens IP1]ELP92041.1 hypothetical protein EIN_291500 [Entamoeba invadens IP1]|eukprot:XP_004258812.1 hypothetical protein EIN_291500 [Entamoeba invadens IP1]